MTPWLQLQRCWNWFFPDLPETQVSDFEASAMDTTEVVACAPTVHVTKAPTDRSMRLQEKRTTVRYPCDREVHFFTDDHAGEPVKARLRNLSATGLGLIVAEAVQAGMAIVIEMDDPLDEDARVLAATIVNVRPMPIRGWFLGCALAQELSDEDLRSLV